MVRSIPVCLAYSDKAASKIDSKFEEEDAAEDMVRQDVGRYRVRGLGVTGVVGRRRAYIAFYTWSFNRKWKR